MISYVGKYIEIDKFRFGHSLLVKDLFFDYY